MMCDGFQLNKRFITNPTIRFPSAKKSKFEGRIRKERIYREFYTIFLSVTNKQLIISAD